MKTLPITLAGLALALLGGCQGGLDWKRLDGGRDDPDRLERAQKTCRIEIKLAGLERAEAERDERLKSASSDAAKMLAKDDYETIRRQVYREIDTCMNRQGYRR